jgi:hypothetical protein
MAPRAKRNVYVTVLLARGVLIVGGGMAIFAPRAADADVSSTDQGMAETLFDSARTLLATGRVAEACPKFAASQRIDPQLGTLLYLATCHEAQGRTATAWAEFRDALDQLARVHEPQRLEYAKAHLAAIKRKLAHVVITAVLGEGKIQVRLDGSPVDAALLGTPLPIDPGEHTVEATQPKHVPFRTTINVPFQHAEIAVAIPALADDLPAAPAAPATSVEIVPPTPSAAPRPNERSSDNHSRIPLYLAVGVGFVGFVTGTVAAVMAIARKNEADERECSGDSCTQRGLDLYSMARTEAWVATASFAVGLGGAGLATVLALSRPKDGERGGAITIAPGPGGLLARARW